MLDAILNVLFPAADPYTLRVVNTLLGKLNTARKGSDPSSLCFSWESDTELFRLALHRGSLVYKMFRGTRNMKVCEVSRTIPYRACPRAKEVWAAHVLESHQSLLKRVEAF